jgi:sulfite dehydrogenase (cytochrome) subunit B
VKKRIVPVFILSLAVTVSAAIGSGISYAIPGETMHTIELPKIKVELKPGAGLETTERYCSICHSPDYITMQPRFPRAKWNAIVNRMIKVMGAPIGEADEKVIVDYLAAQYGTGQ